MDLFDDGHFRFTLNVMFMSSKSGIFSYYRINFEFPPTGGIVTEARFETAKLLRYLSRTDYVLMGK